MSQFEVVLLLFAVETKLQVIKNIILLIQGKMLMLTTKPEHKISQNKTYQFFLVLRSIADDGTPGECLTV